MKILTNRQIPHPVLWEEKDDYKTSSEFGVELSYRKSTKKEIELKFFVKLKSEILNQLINENKAEILLHFECSDTKYRETKVLKIGENKILLDRTRIEGDLYILPLITAKGKIEMFKKAGIQVAESFSDIVMLTREYI